MQIRTYAAPDLPRALARARAELGPDALVLATNEVRGRLGLTRIEITVAVDRNPAPESDPRLMSLAREAKRIEPASPAPRTVARDLEAKRAPASSNPAVEGAVRALIRSGLSDDLARRFARVASSHLGPAGDASDLATAAEQGIAGLINFTSPPLGRRVLFVVGPPGSGKTTTTAKLAARLRIERGRDVVFAEADSERIGCLEQARIFSRHIGAEARAVDSPDQLRALVRGDGESRRMVLVDTAGVGAADSSRLAAIGDLRRAVPDAGVALLIPAGLHHEEVGQVIDRFQPLRPDCVGFSRVDDSRRLGDLVTGLSPVGLPLAFVTDGHRVPQDLQQATPRGVAALLMRAGYRSGSPQEIDR